MTTTPEPWPYLWTETAVENVHGQPVISHAAPEDPKPVFAGPLARAMMEGPRTNPDEPVYIGIGTRRGRHVGIERKHLFRHTFLFGITGYGKSTVIKNVAKQIIESGAGLCFFDPKGQDSIELHQTIPDHRLKDVVRIEPGQNRSAVTGFNFLEVGVPEDHPMYDVAVENVVADLRRMIGADDYWGPLMDGVCSNLIRGTTRLERDFNILDLYYILIDKEARAKYAKMLQAEGLTFLADYAEKIEEMDDDDLDALQRRFKDWVEDPLARSTVAHRGTDINMESIVDENKILIVRMAEQSEDLKKMVGTALLQRIWSVIRSRAATYDTEYPPFFLMADEFDLLATKDSSVMTMLSKARSLSLALFLCCQHPGQLPTEVVNEMYANCDTAISFSPGSPSDARIIAQNLGMDANTLRGESEFHVWTQLTLSEMRERSDAFRVYTFPPFPPLRGMPDTMHAIEWSVRKYGRPPLTDDEMRRGLILNGAANAELMAGRSEEDERAVVKAVFDTALRADAPDGWVTLDEVLPTLRDRFDFDGDGTDAWQRLFQHVRDDWLDVDGERIRAKSPRSTLGLVGENRSAGGIGHASLLWDAYRPLTKAGLDVSISEASGTDPDALATPAPEPSAPSVVERLTAGGDARIEAEHSTGKSKPGQTIRHTIQATNEGRRTIVLCRPEVKAKVHDTLFVDPLCARARDGNEVWFYNSQRDLRIGGEAMARPGSTKNVWVRNETTGEYILRDDEGTDHARFPNRAAVFEDADAYPGGDVTVKRPVIATFEGPPDATIVVVPKGATSLGDLTIDAAPEVSERATPLYSLLQREVGDGEFTRKEALDLTTAHDIDVSQSTLYRWVDDLRETGAIIPTGKTDSGATRFSLPYS